MSNEVLERMLNTCSHFQENENASRVMIVEVIPKQEKVVVYREDISYQYEMSYDYINSFMNTSVWWRLTKVNPNEYRDMYSDTITIDDSTITLTDGFDMNSVSIPVPSALDEPITDQWNYDPGDYYGPDMQMLDLTTWANGNDKF